MLEGDNLLREMDYAPPERAEEPQGWEKVKATFRALARLPENLRRLNEMVQTLDDTGAVKRFERCARIMDNQQATQRQLVGEVQAISHALYEVGNRLPGPETPPRLPAQD